MNRLRLSQATRRPNLSLCLALGLVLALPALAAAQSAAQGAPGAPPTTTGGKPAASAAPRSAGSPAKPAPDAKARVAPNASAADRAPNSERSASRKALQSQAKGLALATEVAESINAAQLEISDRVLTGTAQCEFSQTVDVERVSEVPGHFRVRFKRASYWMVPEETATGAVRLVDRQRQVIWLQIPSKSMMMDQGAGRRLVDSCQHAEQRAAVEAADAAGQSSLLGR